MIKRIICAAAAVFLCHSLMADEGMWMINSINRALELKMQERGLLLTANQIYDADAPGTLLSTAFATISDPQRLAQMSTNIKQLAKFNSAEEIASRVIDMAKNFNPSNK